MADNKPDTAHSSFLMALLNVKRVTVLPIFKVLCVKNTVPSTSIEMWKVAGAAGALSLSCGVYIASDIERLREKWSG